MRDNKWYARHSEVLLYYFNALSVQFQLRDYSFLSNDSDCRTILDVLDVKSGKGFQYVFFANFDSVKDFVSSIIERFNTDSIVTIDGIRKFCN
jgi:hypothetical protein